MDDLHKTKEQLVTELVAMRQRIAELEESAAVLPGRTAEEPRADIAEDMQTVYEKTPAILHSIDAQGRIVAVSDRWLKWLGYERHEVLGRPSTDFLTEESRRSAAMIHLPEFFQKGFAEDVPCHFLKRSGEIADTLLSATSVTDSEGRFVRSLSYIRDITGQKKAEEDLQEAANQWQTTFDSVKDVVWLLDADMRIVRANRATESLFSLDPKQIVGRHCWEIVHGTTEPIDNCPVAQSAKSLRRERAELLIGHRWLEITADPIVDDSGSHIGCVHTITDITQRKRADEALVKSEARLAEAERVARIGNWEWDARTNEVSWSAGTYRIFGVTPEEFSPDYEGHLRFIPPEEREEYQRMIQECLSDKEPFEYEIRVITDTEQTKTVWVHGYVILDDQGNPVGMRGTAQDITDRKKAEVALRASEDLFRRYFELGAVGMAITSPEMKWLRVNDRMCDMLGYTRSELQSLTWADLTHPEDLSSDLAKYNQVLRGDIEGYRLDKRFVRKDGEIIYTTLHVSCKRRDNGTVEYFMGHIQDITDRKKAEVALRASEARYKHVFESAGLFVSLYDREGRCLMMNPTVAGYFGGKPSDFTGKTFSELHPDTAEEYSRRIREVIETGEPREYEDLVEFPSGLRWLHSEVRRVDSPAENVEAGQILSIDITERKRAEQDLQNHVALMESLVEAIPAPVFFKNTDHVYIGCNKAFSEFLGLPRERIIGKSVFDVAPRDHAKVYRAQDESLFRTSGVQIYETTVKAQDGVTRHVMFHKATFADSLGTVVGMIGVMVDITERKRAEDALKESERRLSTLFSNLPGMAYRCANFPNWTMEFISEGCNELTGYSPEDLVGNRTLSYGDLIHPEDRQMVWDGVQEALDGKSPFELHYRIRTRSGDEKWVWERGRGVPSGRPDEMKLEGFISDVTQYRRLEEQLREAQKMEAVGTLAGGIAHDFNNLLQIISGHSELLEMELAQKGLSFDELGAIRQASNRGADLVKQILTFSRRVEAKFEHVNLNEVAKETEMLLYRTIPKMIEIEMKLEKNVKPVRADSNQVEQMLINLALNAQDAMPAGGKFTIETRNADLDEAQSREWGVKATRDCVLLKVSDTGHGMTRDVQMHIFEPFFTTKGLAGGTGLGLATVFGIVKMHGGHVACESEVGKGTTFFIYFPAAEASEEEGEEVQEVTAVEGGTETILVVDDEPLIAGLVKKILEDAGYRVVVASSGKEAVEIYARLRSEIALVILDLIMPEMGGRQCLERLLKINPQIRALIASGFSVKGEQRAFLDKEAKGMVSKPFNIRDLLRSVRHVLDGA